MTKERVVNGALTVSAMNLAVIAWFRGEYQDPSTAARQVFANLNRMLCDPKSGNAKS